VPAATTTPAPGSPSPLSSLPVDAPSCVTDQGSLCARVFRLTQTDWISRSADDLVAHVVVVLLVIVVAVVLRFAVHRAIRRLTEGAREGRVPALLRPLRDRAVRTLKDAAPLMVERRTQRAQAIGSVLRSFSTILIYGVAFVLILGEFGVNLAPIIASAGIVGVAIGFGAQNLVRDFLSGIFMMLEDQYGVGDVVDLGEATGTVEAVGLRTTRLRDAHGVVWYARNGEVLRVGNKSQGFAQVVIDMPVAHDTDLEHCRTVMQEVADTLYAEPEWAGVLLAEPESLGVEQITAEGVVMRVQVRASSAEQWRVGRELRLRLKERFAEEGIATPLPLLRAPVAAVGP
jgi:small conductance mechanosensitive channel